MRAYLTSHLLIALSAIILAAGVFGCAWYIDKTFAAFEQRLASHIDESIQKLQSLSEITDRNGADELTERIIIDCPRRTEFENLLNRLGTASKRELLNVQQLFESCGSFYSERKALMVAELEREFEELQNELLLLGDIRDLTSEESQLSKWGSLVEMERTRSNFLTEQTNIQSEIITLLIEGSAGNARINELVRQAQGISESLAVTDVQLDALRLSLL